MNKWIVVLLILCMGCRRDEFTILPYELYQLPQPVRVNAICPHPDGEMAAVGGVRLQEGHYFKSTGDGQHWSSDLISTNSSAYCLHFKNDSVGWIGGDSLKLWRTQDASQWNFHWLGNQVPYHDSDRPAVRGLTSTADNNIYFVGGDYYYKGVAYASRDGGNQWDFSISDNALYTLLPSLTQSDHVQVWGFGSSLVYNGNDWQTADIPNDHFTAVLQTNNGNTWAASQTGQFYRRGPNANTWEKQKDFSNSTTIWLSCASLGSFAVFGSSNGQLLITTSDGAKWNFYSLGIELPMHCLCIHGGYIWCGSESGQVIRVQLPT